MKKVMVVSIIVLIVFAMFATPVLAKGPTNAGGIKPVEEWGIPWAPYNDNAFWHSGQSISPSVLGVGTQTTIVLDDVTIVVEDIPEATYDDETDEWTGTHLMYKASHAWMENPSQKNAWVVCKFWLNGSGPVDITYTYTDGTVVTDSATEFIFFKVQYVGGGNGNSDYDVGRNFDITIQAYK